MIYLSQINPTAVKSNDSTILVARKNTEIIWGILNDPNATDFDIMVDVGGIIYLAPYTDPNTSITHVELDGGVINANTNLAKWCLTFQYGASFATSDDQTTIMKFKNFQIEASDKAFLFETIDEATKVEVTDLYNSQVSVCWFGAVADSGNSQTSINNATDNHAPFDAAINCFKNIPDSTFDWKFIVNVPASLGVNINLYCLKSPLIIHSSVHLSGAGKTKSQLIFPNVGGGITISEKNIGGKSAAGCEISNLSLFGPLHIASPETPIATYDKGSGITIRVNSTINEVKIGAFDENGIHLSANVISGSNANSTQLMSVHCLNNSINGILVDTAGLGSGDTNACLISAANVVNNGACGIRDESFLGNTYIGCHSSANSFNSGNRSRVFNNLVKYICFQDNVNVEPGLHPNWRNYWKENGSDSAPSAMYSQWIEERVYVMSFGYAIISTGNSRNNKSLLLGNYSEGNQLGYFNGSFLNNIPTTKTDNLVIGGTGIQASVPGSLFNSNNVICSQNFKATQGNEQLPNIPNHTMMSNPDPSSKVPSEGGFGVFLKLEDTNQQLNDRYFNYGFVSEYKTFGFRMDEADGFGQMFAFKDSFENIKIKGNVIDNIGFKFFGKRTIVDTSAVKLIYPTMMQPLFLKFLDRNYSRLLGFTDRNPELEQSGLMPGFCVGDLFLFSNIANVSKKQLGWRCIESSSVLHPNGRWEELPFYQPAEATVINNTPNAGDTYSKIQAQGTLNEIRELKEKLRDAGILLT